MKIFKKFLCVFSVFVTALFALGAAACTITGGSSESGEQPKVPVRITATYEQSATVFSDTPMDELRDDLTVTVKTSKQNSYAVEDYTLSGVLAVGESVITVTYSPAEVAPLTATFTVTVSEGNAHEHVFTNYVSDNNAKCGKDGTKTAFCDLDCGKKDVIVDEGTALSHAYSNYVSDNNAECEKDGTKTAECDHGCGEKDVVTDVGSALAHTFTNYVSDNNAECEKDGTKTAECDHGCGKKDVVADVGSALAHTFTNYVSDKNATCQKDGTKTASCDHGCGKTDVAEDVGSKVDHTFENYVLNNDAECEKDGTKTSACKFACGVTDTVEAVGSALGHTYLYGVCERCPKTNHISVVTTPSVAMSYYGETPTFSAGVVKNELGETVTAGTWSISGLDYKASGNANSITSKGTVTFAPTGTAYLPATVEITVRLTAVAIYNEVCYATVDGALEKANESNSGTVYVVPLGNSLDSGKAKIAKTVAVVSEIKSGVTLFLPYAEEEFEQAVTYVRVSDSDEYKKSAFGRTQFLKNQIYIAQDHTLANAGKIEIAGEVSGGASMNYAVDKNYANSMTAGRHAQINLGKNAKLTSTGTVNCYGFINEETKDNGSEFIVENGNATVLFTIVEYRGGSVYFGMVDPSKPEVNSAIVSAAVAGLLGAGQYTPDSLQVAPINRFYIESVTAKTTVKYGAKMAGHAVLFAEEENHATTIDLINNKDAIIALTKQGGYVTYKYDYATHKTDLDIFGDMTLNPLKLSLSITKSAAKLTTTVEITLTTGKAGQSSGVFFPISDYFDISLNAVNGAATANLLNQKVKLLPGAKLTVGEGVTVNANEIAVYASNNLFKNGADTHYTTATAAELIVKGTLNVKAIGGAVKVGGDNAKLNVTGSAFVISKEIARTESGKSATLSIAGQSVSLPYTGVYYSTDANSTLSLSGATLTGETMDVREYFVKDGKWAPILKVAYNFNGGSASETGKFIPYGNELKVEDLVAPERKNYEFLGWYTSENFASGTEFKTGTLTEDINLYAKWEKIAGLVLVDFKAVGADASDIEKTKTFESQEIGDGSKMAVAPAKAAEYNSDVTYARCVVGYYTDESCAVAFDFSQEITENTTIYVKWDKKVAVTISKGANVSSYSVTVGGKSVSETNFYVISGVEIKVTATSTGGLKTTSIKITESYGGKEASKSSYLFGASATLTFNASGDTTVTIVGS